VFAGRYALYFSSNCVIRRRLVRVLNCDDFVLKGVYHNGCMTKYLLKSSPKNEQKQDSELSSNEIAFQNLIHEINDDLVVHKKGFSDDTIT
jgi:hypothetical protein